MHAKCSVQTAWKYIHNDFNWLSDSCSIKGGHLLCLQERSIIIGLQLVLLAHCHVITFDALVWGWQRKLCANIIHVPVIAVGYPYVSMKRGMHPVSIRDLYNADSWFLLLWHQFDASAFSDGSVHEMYSLLQKYTVYFAPSQYMSSGCVVLFPWCSWQSRHLDSEYESSFHFQGCWNLWRNKETLLGTLKYEHLISLEL